MSDTVVSSTKTGLYAYAYMAAGADLPDGLPGVGRQPAPVGRITRGDLAVLVSDVDTEALSGLFDEDVSEDSELAKWAREHDRVVRTAFEQGAVLPFRFATVLQDRAAAEHLLAEQYDAALAMLAHVRDRVEWGVRVRARPGSPSSGGQADQADRSSGAAYLASRRRRLRDLDERREQARDTAATVREELAAWVADTVDRPGRDALLDIALLVDRANENEFLARAGELAAKAADAGLVLDITGPWPPYSFARTGREAADA